MLRRVTERGLHLEEAPVGLVQHPEGPVLSDVLVPVERHARRRRDRAGALETPRQICFIARRWHDLLQQLARSQRGAAPRGTHRCEIGLLADRRRAAGCYGEHERGDESDDALHWANTTRGAGFRGTGRARDLPMVAVTGMLHRCGIVY